MMNSASRKLDVLSCIKTYSEQRGFPPTVREICVMTGLKSPSSVHYYIVQLKEDGLIESDESKPRTLTIK